METQIRHQPSAPSKRRPRDERGAADTKHRWINDLGTVRNLFLLPRPMMEEQQRDWLESTAKSESDVSFTIYERSTMRPIGNTVLAEIDLRNRSAMFGILIGEPDARGKGYGTETTRLILDYAFTVVGLHNVMLTAFEFNPAGIRFVIR